MLQFSANLTMIFGEVDFLERFEQAHRAGFQGVEYLFPYQWKKETLAEKLRESSLEQVLFNLPAGDWAKGERGIACLPDRVGEFQDGVGKAIDYAKMLRCRRVNCLVGNTPAGVAEEKVHAVLVENLRFAAAELNRQGITLLIEPLNIQDMPGFYLTHTRDALRLIGEVGAADLKLQYDIYHMQIMEGNLTKTIRDHMAQIAHIQLADNPGRHEPGTGEINFRYLLRAIDEAGYQGWIGCEYRPAGRTADGLAWMKPYLA
jgi:hydroxypyruvate isomerase